MQPKRILITPGEPSGIGPDITIKIAQQKWDAQLIVLADPVLLKERAALLKLPLNIRVLDNINEATPHLPQSLQILPINLVQPVKPGELQSDNASYVLAALKKAAQLCLQQEASAIVTGPVHKGIINAAGIHFTGHTEYFAQLCQQKLTTMLFLVDNLKVALLTTHVRLKDVPKTITPSLLNDVLLQLNAELQTKFQISHPRILICGLNPHAGEQGYLGREEIEVINPVLESLRKKGLTLIGPLPADTVFTPRQLQQGDAVLAMYHDQALPVVKQLGFGHAVNVTLGLPIIRTSVDHGTALDMAGTGEADENSLAHAITWAIKLSRTTPQNSHG